MSARRTKASGVLLALLLVCAVPGAGSAQNVAARPPATIQASSLDMLVSEVQRLQKAIEALQTELSESRRETAAVQQALQALRAELDEERALLEGQMATIEQAKVESGSKYRVKLFGMALMQLVSTRGALDNIDLPLLAVESQPGDSGGNVSAAVRQSYLGIAVFGPSLGKMQTSGELRLDFFGGFPGINDGLSAPGLRLRTMGFAADGTRYSFRAGQEAPFFSSLSPTSLASTAYPALSSAGNIWAWTPQLYVERRFQRSDTTTIAVRGGVMDALTGEVPAGEYSRLPTAGERSRMPAAAGHVSWRRTRAEQVTSLGAGGYYSRHNWSYDRNVHAWAATGDLEFPLTRVLGLSGEVYGGQAIGGLGGGAHSSVLFRGSPSDPASTVHALRSVGGWAQFKVTATPRLEFNTAAGFDRSEPSEFAGLLEPPNNEVPAASKNASSFVNVIYRARSNIFVSVEYRRLWTRRFDGRAWLADHLNVGGGIAF